MLDVDRIQPSQFQPRHDFAGLEGLVESIRENGIVQPVIVRQEGERYELIAGERRWRAAQLAGMTRIPVVIRKVAQDRVLELALVENIQRKDLNPIEEARAYDLLIGQMNLSQAEVAKRVGRERSSVANSLRLLKLPDKVQKMLQDGGLTPGHAKAIVAISDSATQIRVADEVVRREMSVRETEALVTRLQSQEVAEKSGQQAGSAVPAEDPNVRAAEEKLQHRLGTKVRITRRGGRGKIEIEFYSEEELDRLFTTIVRGN
jgi:ParB family chromosome partitioning protein